MLRHVSPPARRPTSILRHPHLRPPRASFLTPAPYPERDVTQGRAPFIGSLPRRETEPRWPKGNRKKEEKGGEGKI